MVESKKLIFTSVYLFFFLVFIIFIFNFLSNKTKQTSKIISLSISPTLFKGYNEKNNSLKQDLPNENKNFIKTFISNPSDLITDAVFIAADGYGENKENIFKEKKGNFAKKLPLFSSDFLIVYNQQDDKFEVYLKEITDTFKNSFLKWAKLNGFSEEEIGSFFEIKTQTINDYLTQNQNNLSLQNNPSSINLSTPSSNLETTVTLLTDLLKIFFSFSNINYSQIESITPPESNPSMLTSLTSITQTANYGIPQGYNPNARGCYTPKRFIEVYADGLTPDGPPNCYQNVKARVESYLTPIDFLGGRIKVHQKTIPYFQAVNQELAPYHIEGRTYRFQQGTYTFSYLGTYAFRCNVNASTTKDVWNVCDPGCILSPHSFGFAIDINPQTNQNHSDQFDMPPEVVAAFRRYGFRWGGEWKDAMHFEYLGEICQN